MSASVETQWQDLASHGVCMWLSRVVRGDRLAEHGWVWLWRHSEQRRVTCEFRKLTPWAAGGGWGSFWEALWWCWIAGWKPCKSQMTEHWLCQAWSYLDNFSLTVNFPGTTILHGSIQTQRRSNLPGDPGEKVVEQGFEPHHLIPEKGSNHNALLSKEKKQQWARLFLFPV